MKIRLNKYLSDCNFGNRRSNSEKIKNGLFKINNEPAKPGDLVDADVDIVTFNNEQIKPELNKIYIALNKPKDYLSTVTDDRGRKTVMDLIDTKGKVYPVGRLDKDSTGLLLLTNDGVFSNKVTHPKYHLSKIYIVETYEEIRNSQITKLSQGVEIYDTKTLPAEVTRLGSNKFKIILHQGIKRQIREMCRAVNLHVKNLKRTEIGIIKLGNLPEGKIRELTEKEINSILKLESENKPHT